MLKKLLSFILVLGMCMATASCETIDPSQAIVRDNSKIKNVILLIGDGMGPNQIKAGELYKEGKLFMQTLKQNTKVETISYYGDTTDSAAAATALATGTRTVNGQVGIDVNGNDLKTLVDIAHEQGKRTGIITTEELYGATPMGFSGHAMNRGSSEILMETAASTGNVNLFASYSFPGNKWYLVDEFTNNGYEFIINPADISESEAEKIIGNYKILAGVESMTLDEMCASFDGVVSEALEYLAKDEDGFFLMAEGAHIDHGGHNNDIMYMLTELLAFDDMVKYVVNWASKRDDTLVMITADHETGGLELNKEAGYGQLFDQGDFGFANYMWTSTGHTSTDVNLYAFGADIDFTKYSSFGVKARIRNTDVFKIANAFLTGTAK